MIENPAVARVFDGYPQPMRNKLLRPRQLVLDTASETAGVNALEETLRWREPSYLTKGGSTLRMDWKAKAPDHYAMYFNCNTSLIATFREVYGDVFSFEGNRAIVFHETDELPVDELKHCISLALTYHRVKHLPLLGAQPFRATGQRPKDQSLTRATHSKAPIGNPVGELPT